MSSTISVGKMELQKHTFLDSTATKKFITFLNKRFDSTGELELQKHLKDYHWPKGTNEKNFEQTFDFFTDRRKQLNAALSNNNEEAAFEICSEILHWGGVGVATKNLAKIKKLRANKELMKTLNSARSIIQSKAIDIGNIEIPCNSGFSKIYTCLDNRFIIYDSRVAAKMCSLIGQCFNQTNPLGLGRTAFQANANRNPGPQFPMLTGHDSKYFESNIKAAWILEELAINNPRSGYSTEKLIFACQTVLFVTGFNLSKIP